MTPPGTIQTTRYPADNEIISSIKPLRKQVRISPIERKFLLIMVDLLLLNAALLFAVWRWNAFDVSLVTVIAYMKWFVTISLFWLLFGSVFDIFNPIRAASTIHIMLNVGIALLITDIIYVATPWLTPKILARNYAFGLIAISFILLLGWRVIYAKWMVQPAFHRRALLLGAWRHSSDLILDIKRGGESPDSNPFRGTGYNLLGYVAEEKPRNKQEEVLPWLGRPDSLPRIARMLFVDDIIVARDKNRLFDPKLHEVLLDCRELGITIQPLSEVYENLTARYPVTYAQLDPDLLLSSRDMPMFRLYHFIKRLMDLSLGILGLLILIPISFIVMLANFIASSGPLFFRQQRIGKGGKPFVMYKFRSMIPNAEQNTGATWSKAGDPRITRIGWWLRRMKLDELPQVINVLKGDMSIVGPRPERPEFVGRLMRKIPIYRARHAIKPGITGWAQVHFRYGNSVEHARVKLEYDLYYVKHQSLFLDILIILKTIPFLLLTWPSQSKKE